MANKMIKVNGKYPLYNDGLGGFNQPIWNLAFDSDAQAFFNAANITNATEKTAVNNLVIDLKSANLWSKMYAIYPFVGGSSASMKYNLKDPRDINAAYRLSFLGTGGSFGTSYSVSGTGGTRAETYLKISDLGVTQSYAMGAWLTELQDQSGLGGVFGAQASFGNGSTVIQFYVDLGLNTGIGLCDPGVERLGSFTKQDNRGLNWFDRINGTSARMYKNTTVLATSDSFNMSFFAPVDRSLWLGGRNDSSNGGTLYKQSYSFAFISNSIGDSNVTTFYNIVNTFVTALNKK